MATHAVWATTPKTDRVTFRDHVRALIRQLVHKPVRERVLEPIHKKIGDHVRQLVRKVVRETTKAKGKQTSGEESATWIVVRVRSRCVPSRQPQGGSTPVPHGQDACNARGLSPEPNRMPTILNSADRASPQQQ